MSMPDFASSTVWMSLLTLTFLEIVLGVDNIIFISIAAGKIPEDQQKRATNIGLVLAMVMRIVLLFGISVLIAMKQPWISFDVEYIRALNLVMMLMVIPVFNFHLSLLQVHISTLPIPMTVCLVLIQMEMVICRIITVITTSPLR